MDKRKYWVTRLFFLLFTVSVSVTVIPCGIILVHGLFGEVTAPVIVEDEDQTIENIKFRYYETIRNVKGTNFINIWFVLMVVVVCISFLTELIKLPRGDTIVTLKVRMDN